MARFIIRGVVCFQLIAFVTSTCNYFYHPEEQAGRRVPVDLCIGDGLNTNSRTYECASDGSSVTSKWFNSSITCDGTTPFVSTVYTSSNTNASFECSGNSACDLCIRTYTSDKADCSDVNTEITSNFVDNCYINDFCNVLTPEIQNDGSEEKRSSKYWCLSKTRWREIIYSGTSECDNASEEGTVTTRKVECVDTSTKKVDSAVLYEATSIPCFNEDNASNYFFLAVHCVVLIHSLTYCIS
eukprot:179847_1